MAVSRSFTAARGLAIAIVLSGSGISSFVVPNLANALVEDHGWRLAYLYLAGIWGVVALPLVVLFLKISRDTQAEPAEEIAAQPPEQLPGLTVREGFTSPTFYKLLLDSPAERDEVKAAIEERWPELAATRSGDPQSQDELLQVYGSMGWVLGLFAILVGGLGMMNAQLMSVVERTRSAPESSTMASASSRARAFMPRSVIPLSMPGSLPFPGRPDRRCSGGRSR